MNEDGGSALPGAQHRALPAGAGVPDQRRAPLARPQRRHPPERRAARRAEAPPRVRLRVQESGGEPPASAPAGNGMGLLGMRERVEALGGELTIHAQPDGASPSRPGCRCDHPREAGRWLSAAARADRAHRRSRRRARRLPALPRAGARLRGARGGLLRRAGLCAAAAAEPGHRDPRSEHAGEGGLSALRRFKLRWPLLPVLVFSMHDHLAFAIQALRAGANGYVTKSSDPQQMVSAVRRVLAGELALSPDLAARMARRGATAPSQPPSGCRCASSTSSA